MLILAKIEKIAINHSNEERRSSGQGIDVVDSGVLVELSKTSVRDYDEINIIIKTNTDL